MGPGRKYNRNGKQSPVSAMISYVYIISHIKGPWPSRHHAVTTKQAAALAGGCELLAVEGGALSYEWRWTEQPAEASGSELLVPDFVRAGPLVQTIRLVKSSAICFNFLVAFYVSPSCLNCSKNVTMASLFSVYISVTISPSRAIFLKYCFLHAPFLSFLNAHLCSHYNLVKVKFHCVFQ